MGIPSSAFGSLFAIPVNSVMPLNYGGEDKVTLAGATFLKSGVTDDDFKNYPSAYITTAVYDGTYISPGVTPRGCAFGAGFYWVGTSTATVVQINLAGAPTGFSFSVSGNVGNIQGCVFDNQNSTIWIADLTSSAIYEYGTDGIYTGRAISVSGQDANPAGVADDGNFLWVIGNANDSVYKYDKATLSYTGDSFSTSSQGTATVGVAIFGDYLYSLTSSPELSVFKYTKNGIYTGVSFSFSAQTTGPIDIGFDGDNFLISEVLNSRVYRFTPSVGMLLASSDSDSGLPLYTRIK